MKKVIRILIIAAVLAAAVFYVTIWNEQNRTAEAMEAYNAAAQSYNDEIAPYNEAASGILKANTAFQEVLDAAAAVADKGEEAYEPDTLKELQEKLEEEKKAFVEVPAQFDPFEMMEMKKSFDKKELGALRQEAEASQEAVKDAQTRIPEVPEVPDYSEETAAVEAARKKYEDSVQKLANITAPADGFVEERLKRIDSIAFTGAVTPENDPNGLLGKKGGYVGCVYFIESSIDRDLLPEGTFWEEPAPKENPSPEQEAAAEAAGAEAAATAGTAGTEEAAGAEAAAAGETETAGTEETAGAEAAAAAGTTGEDGAEADESAAMIEMADAVKAGADGGGAVEIFQSKEDAEARIKYFEFFEGSIMQPGAAEVEGTCVIRTSRYMDEEKQEKLIKEIRKMLLLVE